MDATAGLRPSPIAGVWYSSNPAALRDQLSRLMDAAQTPALPAPLGLIAPHAGYRYSGRTAAHAFRCVRGLTFDVVAVLSPLHHYLPHPVITSAHSAYQTPLGAVEIDQPALQRFTASLAQKDLEVAAVSQDGEHSLEIELPFLQTALAAPFTLLPVMLRTLAGGTLQAVASALVRALEGRRALLVASSDLSHFHPQTRAEQLDAVILGQIEQFSPEGVLHAERSRTGFACGAPAVAAVLWAARALGANKAAILHYSTSAQETGDLSSVVGYGAAALYRE